MRCALRFAPLWLVALAAVATAAPPEDAKASGRAQGAVVGRVTRPDGSPVADVAVRVVARRRAARDRTREVRTGADGRYRCEGVPWGDVAAFVADRGLVARGTADFLASDAGALGRTLRAGGTASIDLVVEPGVRMDGRVLHENGDPLVGAAVDAVPTGAASRSAPLELPTVTATTASDGNFTLEGLVPGVAYDLGVQPDGAPLFEHARATAGVPAPEALLIRLPRLREIRLTVLEAAAPEPPIPHAIVHLRRERTTTDLGPGRGLRTDEQGRVRLLVPAGESGTARVEAEGWSATDLAPLPEGDEAIVRLRPLRTITGRVLFADGSPAAGVRVGAFRGFEDPEARESVSGEDGRFTLTDIPAGPVIVGAATKTKDGAALRAMGLAPEGTKDVALRLLTAEEPSGAVLRVTAVGPGGVPVSRAVVGIRTTGGGTIRATMKDGVQTLDLGDFSRDAGGIGGSTVLVARAEDAEGVPLPFGPAVVGPLAADQTAVEVRLPPERVLTGSVRGPRGEPIVGARVCICTSPYSSDNVRNLMEEGGATGGWALARTDESGEFRAPGLPREEVRVFVSPPLPFATPAALVVPPGTDRVEVSVEAADRAEVTVLDPAGTPVVGARVCALDKPGRCDDGALTDARGVAAVTDLRAGRKYVLHVEPSWDYLAWTQTDWTPAPTTVRLERSFGLSGFVRTPDGKPIVKAFVQHDDAGTVWWAQSTNTDEEGAFHFSRLRAGSLTITAELGDRLAGSEKVPGPVTQRSTRVEAGSKGVVLLLDPGRTVEIVPPPRVPEGTDVHVCCERGTHRFGGRIPVSHGERMTISGLADGDRLTYFVAPDASGRSAVAVGTPADTPIRLRRNVEGSIRGRVALPEGVTEARVWAREERLDFAIEARTDATGRYEMPGVPEDWSWTVQAWVVVDGARLEGEIQHVRRGDAPDIALGPAR